MVARVLLVAALAVIWGLRREGMEREEFRFEGGERVRVDLRIGGMEKDGYGRRWTEVKNLRIVFPEGKEVWPGQRVLVEGMVDSWGRERGDIYLLRVEELEMLDLRKSVFGRMLQAREVWAGKFLAWLPLDEASLAVGIVMGGNEYFSQEMKQAYARAGVTHVVAASGYNVSVISGWAMIFAAGWLGRKLAIPFVILCIILYAMLAGLSLPVVRAGIMGVLTVAALGVGRKADAGWLLVMTTLGMLAWNPRWAGEISFQLSVAATAGLVWLLPGEWERMIAGDERRRLWFVEDLKVTVTAQIATLPLILHHFGQVGVLAPAVNALTLWIVPLAMQILALALGAGLMFDPAGGVISLLAWPFLKLFNGAALAAGGWDHGSLVVEKMSGAWVVGYYLLLGLYMFRKSVLGKDR